MVAVNLNHATAERRGNFAPMSTMVELGSVKIAHQYPIHHQYLQPYLEKRDVKNRMLKDILNRIQFIATVIS
jgi:hypothetical protein